MFRRRRQRGEMIAPVAGAGHGPGSRGELAALLPVGSGPDVLGVRRHRPAQPAHRRGVARDRGRGVQKMRVQMADIGRQFGRQHQRLAPAPDAVRRRIARQVGEPDHGARRHSPAARGPARQPARTRRGASFRYSGRYRTGARIRSCTGWRARSVGWRSDTIRMSRPRRSSAAISCAIKVSDRRG